MHVSEWNLNLTSVEKALYNKVPRNRYGTPKPEGTIIDQKEITSPLGGPIVDTIAFLEGLLAQGYTEIEARGEEGDDWCYECGNSEVTKYYISVERPLNEEELATLARIETKIRDYRRQQREEVRKAKEKRIEALEAELQKLKGDTQP